MKVLYLSDSYPPDNVGGAAVVAHRLANAVQDRKHEVAVITTSQTNTSFSETSFEGIKIYQIPSKYNLDRFRAYQSLYNLQTLPKIKEILADFRPDIVHAHNIHAYLSYHSLKISHDFGAKVFLTAHDVMSFNYRKMPGSLTGSYKINPWQQLIDERFAYFPLRNTIIRWYLSKFVNQIFAVSNALNEALKQNGIRKVVTVHNGIDLSDFSLDKKELANFRRKYHLTGYRIIHFGGRLSRDKGTEALLRALALVSKKVPNVRLLVFGSSKNGREENFMTSLSLALKLLPPIFTGNIFAEELVASYYASDVCIIPSLCFDSFPTNILEAMACGKPVIATIFGGSREVVLNGKTGFIINPYRLDQLAGKLYNLLIDPKSAHLFGKTGREWIAKEFSIRRQRDQILRFYHGEE